MTAQHVSNRILHCLILTTLLLLVSMRASAIGPIILPEGSFSQTITPYTAFYEDTSASLSLTQILASDRQLSFTPTHTVSLKRGATSGVVWIRMSVLNPFAQEMDSMLTLSNSRIDSVRVFNISNPGQPLELNAPQPQGSLSQAHVFSLSLGSKATSSYLIRLETDALMTTRIALKSLDQFNLIERVSNLLTGALLGLVSLVLLYFLFAFARGDKGMLTAGIMCSVSVMFFVPASVGISVDLPINMYLPNGCIETFSIGGILIAQLLALLKLNWRQNWIRALIKMNIAAQVAILLSDVFTPSYQTELLLYITTTLVQLLTVLLTTVYRSKHPESHVYLRSAAIVIGLGMVVTLMHKMNLINMPLTEQMLVFLLPLSAAAGLFFSQRAISAKYSHREISGQPGIPPETMGQISHELRTPINGVIGMSELLTDTPLSITQRDHLETIKMAGNDLLVLVNELSDLGKLKAREVFLDIKPVRVINLLNRTLGHFQQEAARKQVELILDLSDDFPGRLLCDRNRLLSVFYNLLSRTLAYTEHGALTVYASYYCGEQAQGLRLQLQISGTVIKQQELESLFRMLQPGNTKVDGNDPHTWNLTVVRGLIRHMRGTLDIESLSSQGGSVTLFIPMQTDTSEDLSPKEQDSSLKGLNVLIVDDNATLRSVIEKQLKRWGVNSDSTYSGKEALAMLRTEHRNGTPYDIVIIDHDMPVMSGLQLAERIRSDEEIRRKPANLMLTGLSTNSVERSASAAGIDYVIAKPASGNRLREALAILQKRRTPAY